MQTTPAAVASADQTSRKNVVELLLKQARALRRTQPPEGAAEALDFERQLSARLAELGRVDPLPQAAAA